MVYKWVWAIYSIAMFVPGAWWFAGGIKSTIAGWRNLRRRRGRHEGEQTLNQEKRWLDVVSTISDIQLIFYLCLNIRFCGHQRYFMDISTWPLCRLKLVVENVVPPVSRRCDDAAEVQRLASGTRGIATIAPMKSYDRARAKVGVAVMAVILPGHRFFTWFNVV